MDLCVMCMCYGTGLCPRSEVWAKRQKRPAVKRCKYYLVPFGTQVDAEQLTPKRRKRGPRKKRRRIY
jgi:hypothetical protein